MVPVISTVQPAGSGTAIAGPPNASESAPAATVPRNASRKRRPTGRPTPPAAVIPPGQAHTLVIEIPNSPEIRLEGIDIEQNRARLSVPPAADVPIPPKQSKYAVTGQHWREIVRNDAAGSDQQKVMYRGSRFQVLPHSRTGPDLSCKTALFRESRTRTI